MIGGSWLLLFAFLIGAFYVYLLFHDPQKALRIIGIVGIVIWNILLFLFKVVSGLFSAISRLFSRRR